MSDALLMLGLIFAGLDARTALILIGVVVAVCLMVACSMWFDAVCETCGVVDGEPETLEDGCRVVPAGDIGVVETLRAYFLPDRRRS
jgi:hypothetical protein